LMFMIHAKRVDKTIYMLYARVIGILDVELETKVCKKGNKSGILRKIVLQLNRRRAKLRVSLYLRTEGG